MSYPRNREEMHRQHYKLVRQTKCSTCAAKCELWSTPNGHWMVLNLPMGANPDRQRITVHRDTCTGNTPEARHNHVARVADLTKARIVIALYEDDAFAYQVAAGISAEDARHELITAANMLRKQMEAKR